VCFAAPWLSYGYALTLGEARDSQIIDVFHWKNDFINGYHLVSKI
jgi:hypothetical protein